MALPLNIGILTSGGDSQGMNAAIRAATRMAIYRKCTPFAIYEGYQGLVKGGDWIKEFSWNDVAQIISMGGTVIGTARCPEFRERSGRLKAVEHLLQIGIHSLVVIGGDGSLTGAQVLREEWPALCVELVEQGRVRAETAALHPFLSIAGIVGSIDNDMVGTELTIGANSALHRIIEAVDAISTSASSHQRTFIIEVMGRHCGWLALMSAIACDADWLLIPEVPCAKDHWESNMCEHVQKNRQMGKRHSIIILSEGAINDHCEPIQSQQVIDILKERLDLEARMTVLGHVQRGGTPSALDRITASFQGVHAVQVLIRSEATEGGDAVLIGIQENQICWLPLADSVRATRNVEAAMKRKDFKAAFELRDKDFKSIYKLLKKMRTHYHEYVHHKISLPLKPLRLGIIHCGAPAGGMNTATKTIVRVCLYKGYVPIALLGGWNAALASDENVRPLTWMDVDGWVRQGGSNIGTNRSLPYNLALVADLFSRHRLDGLVIMGGYEAFHSLKLLHSGRAQHPALNIPIVVIPATISNNVPGTEASLGCDTALNMIVSSCDAIRQSASSTKRVFVVEVQGGHCGYLSMYSGLAAGATNSYLPEEGISISDIIKDSRHLIHRFLDDRKQGRLLMMNEFASQTYTSDVVASILNEEGKGVFDVKTSKLGHLQQGGNPSPFDRINACRLAMLSITHIEELLQSGVFSGTQPSNLTAVLIGIRNGQVVFNDVDSLAKEADDAHRRPKSSWWLRYRPIVRILSKYNVPEYQIDKELICSRGILGPGI